MKIIGSFLILVSIVLVGFGVKEMIQASYQWDNQFQSYWDLSTKASSVEQKSDYMDQFVSALQASGLQGQSSALFYKTPNNSFDQNFVALLSLQSRLHDLKTMDPSSFQYNTAIEQITSQEQDQGTDEINVFNDVWTRVHFYGLWNPFYFLGYIVLVIVIFIIGCICISAGRDTYSSNSWD